MSSSGNGSKSPVFELEQAILDHLGEQLAQAVSLRNNGEVTAAEKVLRDILETEPRLAEPRLELAHIALSDNNLEEAENQARYAVELLRSYGPWTTVLTAHQLLSYALTLHGEVLSSVLDTSEDTLEDHDLLVARWDEIAALFAEAVKLDPKNEAAAGGAYRYRPIKRTV